MSVIVIPIIIVAIAGLVGYLVYHYLIAGMSSRRAVHGTLSRYDIDKTPAQIIREFYAIRGQHLSEREIRRIEGECMRNDPDQFLSMYDAIREAPEGQRQDQGRDARGDDDPTGDRGV